MPFHDQFVPSAQPHSLEKSNNANALRDKKISEARDVLRGGDIPSSELKKLYQELQALDQFAYAGEVLNKKIDADKRKGIPITLKEYQTLAKFIYKDESLPSSFKFDRAMDELRSNDDLDHTKSCETLGLAGAIHKYKWQYDHQFKNLVLSRFYYSRGFELWKEFVSYFKDQGLGEDALDSSPNLFATPGRSGDNDDGYTAINYAYICELIAVDRLEEIGKTIGIDEYVHQQFEESKKARIYILEYFLTDYDKPQRKLKKTNLQNWVYATIAEAYFGLRDYNAALEFISAYIARTDVQDWEKRTFSKQLFSNAYLQIFLKNFIRKYSENKKAKHKDDSDRKGNSNYRNFINEAVKKIDEERINQCLVISNADRLETTGITNLHAGVKKDGKLGLALSGGGFRASLFHIGVLAALAEKDELRNIEVISCVSGGSIIGAFYYLKLKELLETKIDKDITKADYIKIVQETEEEFLAGVKKNLRVRLFTHLPSNFKMLFNKNYSRTHRMGELYEKYLFKGMLFKNADNVEDGDAEGTDRVQHKYTDEYEKADSEKNENELNRPKRVKVSGDICMDQLIIKPLGAENFSITNDNWKRKNKVPQLVLNATSVNTGHNWQFTASWMGEPPGNIQPDIDVKPRLRRMYYQDAPEPYKKFRLGYAVGASSCVPVMFHPMPMFGLYEDIDLQLIDGGLHDNQGIAALIEQECKNMIISDASGQLPTSTIAETSAAGIFYRADNILQERLRELQFMDIKERNYTTQLNKLMVVTLKNDLPNEPVSWKYCKDPKRKIVYFEKEDSDNDLTKYFIQRNIQTRLSEIRTDLDAFNDTEAAALMYSGYQQVNHEYSCSQWDSAVDTDNNKEKNEQVKNPDWVFKKIKPYMDDPKHAAKIEPILKTGKKLALKVVDINKSLRITLIILGILAALGLIYAAFVYYDAIIKLEILVQGLVIAAIAIAVGFFSKMVANLINYKSTIRKYTTYLLLAFVLWIICNGYMKFFNRIYLKAGEIRKGNNITTHS